MIFVSVHIPKTAGTSLAYVFDHGTDRRVLFDYSSDYSNTLFRDGERERFEQALPYLLQQFRFIHGHFYLEKYRGVVPGAKYISCLRDPVDRVISQYRHVWYEGNPASPVVQRIAEGLDIVDFARGDYNVGNAQRRHLGDVPPGELDFVFISERLGEGLAAFQRRFPGVIRNAWAADVPKINDGETRERKSNRPTIEITAAQITALRAAIPEEIDYYRRAVQAFEASAAG